MAKAFVMNHEASKRLARIIADRADLTITFEERCDQPRTNLETGEIFVQLPRPFWDKSQTDEWFGTLVHEIGHHHPDMRDDLTVLIREGFSMQSLFGFLYNIISDYRNEYTDYGMYQGRDEALDHLHSVCIQRGIDGGLLSQDPPDAKSAFIRKVFTWIGVMRGRWQPNTALPAHIVAEQTEGWQAFNTVNDDLDAMTTADDCLAICRKLLKADPDMDEEQEEQESKAEADGMGDAEGDGADGEGAEAKAGDKSEDSDLEAESWVSYKDLLEHDHSNDAGYTGSASSIKYDHTRRRDYIPYDKMLVETVDYDARPDREYLSRMTKHYAKSKGLAGVVRKLLQTRSQVHYQTGYRNGKISARSLHRVKSGSDKVFKRKSEAISLDVAVTLLVDMSGSMHHGDRYTCAAAASAMLNDAIAYNNIPLEIIGFTERDDTGCQHYIFKSFNQRVEGNKMLRGFAAYSRKLHQNADGESILYALGRLRAQRAQRKILIVLSDGSPACDKVGDCYTFTEEAIKYAGKHVDIMGIGIETRSVRDLYPKHMFIRDTNDLEPKLLEVIKDKILGSK